MDVRSSDKRKNTWHTEQFTDMVLSMSLEEVLDEDLYKGKVEKIPDSFQSVNEYLGSYIFPLMEETRAEVSAALEAVYKAPFAEVLSMTQSKHDKLKYNLKLNYWRNKVSDRGKEPYRTLPGDVVILSNLKPETDTDLQRYGCTCIFAAVQSINDGMNGDDCTAINFSVRTAKQIDVEDLLRKSMYIVFLVNLGTNKRIWKALHEHKNLKAIENVLSRNKLIQDVEGCDICCCKYSRSTGADKIGSDLLKKLNESQNQTVTACISSLECNHKPSLQLIWGPPGTGKTKTLSTLLLILLRMGVRTLICAPTNVAISELATRLVKLVRDSCTAQEGSLDCSLGDIIIFGNKDKLKITSEVEDTFLDIRVERLVDFIGPVSGWKHNVTSMINFLDDCVSQHSIYLEGECNSRIHWGIVKSMPKSLLQYARERFKQTVLRLRKCMLTFIRHVPRELAPEKSIQLVQQLMSIVDLMETLLFEESMTSEELENVFSCKEGFGDSCTSLNHLSHVRSRCLNVLRAIYASLAKLCLPKVANKNSMVEFCFQNASLIFCTTSSAYKLHHVEMGPISVLVIDEAAQVKECESIIPLQIPDVMHVILAGDEKQLTTMVTSKVSEEVGLGKSLFERLSSLGHLRHMLKMQYRMHPSISLFPNSSFYHNQILDAPTVQNPSHERRYLERRMFGPYSFINVVGGVEQADDLGRSKRNMVEVAVVVKLVDKLHRAWINGFKENLSIGVISPYASQVVAIQAKLRNYENLKGFAINVKSVDGFQGGEEDVVIISTVRVNKGGFIGFLSTPERTNVALTRARYCMWILGNARTLSSSGSIWEALVLNAIQRQCFFNANEDNDLEKTITDVRKDLNKLDEMLHSDSIFFKNARWKVVFGENFRRSFRVSIPAYLEKLVISLLLKIASGWRPKVKVDTTLKRSSYIVKQFRVEDYYVICFIDVMKEGMIYKQVLYVWDIVWVGSSPKLLDRLDTKFAPYTSEFTKLCKEKCFEGDLEVPKSWSCNQVGQMVRFKNTSECSQVVENKPSCEAAECSKVAAKKPNNQALEYCKGKGKKKTEHKVHKGKEPKNKAEIKEKGGKWSSKTIDKKLKKSGKKK